MQVKDARKDAKQTVNHEDEMRGKAAVFWGAEMYVGLSCIYILKSSFLHSLDTLVHNQKSFHKCT